MVPGISVSSSIRAADFAESRDGFYAAAGIHPSWILSESAGSIDDLPAILLRPGVIAVGETGLDLHHDRVPLELQIDIFRQHIRLAETFGLTLIVHSRGAEREVLDVLGDTISVPVIMHCFTGPSTLADEAVEKGYYLGFAGPLTFRNNDKLRALAGALPVDRILIETDSPYLSPEPLRGRRNEPANVKHIALALAGIWGMDPERTSEILLSNSLNALQLAPERRTDLVYYLYNNIYMNITGRCSNRCRFCIKDRVDGIGGYYLKHHAEPDGDQLESIIETLSPSMGRELVFCGYGEPTMRPDLLRKLALKASEKGFSVRLNTNGTCLEWLSLDETIKMLKPFDSVSVSLNTSSAEEYNRICCPDSDTAWNSMIDFIKLAGTMTSVKLTSVRHSSADTKQVAQLAKDLGLPLRIRG